MSAVAEEHYNELMLAIVEHAEARRWIPIGFKTFDVGPWTVTVNGTKEDADDVPPWHARVIHKDVVAIMLFGPQTPVTCGGWQEAPDQFLADMREATARLAAGGTR